MLVTEDSRPWKSFSFTQEFSTLVRNLRPASVKLLFLASLVVVTNFAGISGFLPMYLRYLDMTEVQAATVVGVYAVALSMSSFAGGIVADHMAHWKPYHGRALMAEISLLVSIALICAIFMLIPSEASSFWLYVPAFAVA